MHLFAVLPIKINKEFPTSLRSCEKTHVLIPGNDPTGPIPLCIFLPKYLLPGFYSCTPMRIFNPECTHYRGKGPG
jgi:hypothetical protein